jgi:hypothetical protein
MKIVSVLLGIVLVIVGGAAIHFSRQAEAGRQQIAALKAQLEHRDAQLVASPGLPAPVPSAIRADAAPSATTAPVDPAPAARPAPVSDVLDIAGLRAQMASPESMARNRQLMRTVLESSNPNLAEALGIAPDEADKLLDLLAAHQEGMSAVFNNNAESGSMTPQERSAAAQQRQQANQAELQALLGSKYPQWEDYQQTRPAWQQLRDLRAVTSSSGAPLTDAQGKSFVAAIAVEHRNITQQHRDAAIAAANQGRLSSELVLRNSPEHRQRLLGVAAAHLSPQQLEGYREMLERAAAQEDRTRATLQRLEAAAAATAPAPQ